MDFGYFLNYLNDTFRFVFIVLVYLLVVGFLCYLILLIIWWSLMLARFLVLFFKRNFVNKDLDNFVFPVLGNENEEGEQDA